MFNGMLVVSSREFRDNQKKYLSMAANGEDIVLTSEEIGSFKLTPVTLDDSQSVSHLSYSTKKERRKAAVDLLLSDYIHDTDLTETTVSDADDIYEY